MMKLPENFLECISKTLKDDFKGYFDLLESEPNRGLRVNTLKADNDTVKKLLGIKMKKTPFCENGFYIQNDIKGLGNNPLHHAGAFYLQEPSAMSAVTALDVKKGDKVLDLCAAPGGKSTQIAAALQGEGLLWSNEIVRSRAKILYSNIERCGIKNAVVSNAHPEIIADRLCGFFDKVLVDAPCSGEGMVRREPNILTEWKEENRTICADRQLKILNSAAKCVKSNGVLVYSTCTLSAEENEMVIDSFIKCHPEFVIDEINADFGRDAYCEYAENADINKCRRILFQDGGEGHFVAKMKFIGKNEYNGDYEEDFISVPLLNEFCNSALKIDFENTKIINNCVYAFPEKMPKVNGLYILNAGVKCGEIIKNRFAPSHGMFVSLKISEIKCVLDLDINDNRIFDFLHGFEIDCAFHGYTAVGVNGIIVGFGKASGGKLKNHYPKGLRILS